MAGRTWTAVLICLAIWFGYLKWFAPIPQVQTKPQSQSPSGSEMSLGGNEAPQSEKVPSQRFAFTEKVEENFVLSNSKVEVGFSDIGGKISRVSVKKYHETLDPASPYVAPVSISKTPESLSTFFSEGPLKDLSGAKFKRTSVDGGVIYTAESPGVKLVKEYRLRPDDYIVDFNLNLSFTDGTKNDWGYLLLPLGGQGLEFDQSQPMQHWSINLFQDGSLKKETTEAIEKSAKKGEEPIVHLGKTDWLSFGNAYFTTALVNRSKLNPDSVFLSDAGFTGGYLRYPLRTKEAGESLQFVFNIYSGPKDLSEVSKIPGLSSIVDYGFFSLLAYPLLHFLNLLHDWFKNYGVAIILLTIVVRGLFYPLSAKSYGSMRAMSKLQPQIQAIKEKYKDDRERQQKEQMALFKAHKVNPAGGCLPMLLQIPVFFALYSVLGNSIELFHAPFFGWIHDLSSKDPYYVYPFLMGVAMFLQQKLTPTPTADPIQKKMMMFMPVIFAFIMANLPSGLTLYIFVSTLLGIAQQWAMMKDPKHAEGSHKVSVVRDGAKG